MLRADFYNVFNHANLGNPLETALMHPEFGIARWGRRGRASGSPLDVPLSESARQIQIMLRLEF
jgi:hypothetical protein